MSLVVKMIDMVIWKTHQWKSMFYTAVLTTYTVEKSAQESQPMTAEFSFPVDLLICMALQSYSILQNCVSIPCKSLICTRTYKELSSHPVLVPHIHIVYQKKYLAPLLKMCAETLKIEVYISIIQKNVCFDSCQNPAFFLLHFQV